MHGDAERLWPFVDKQIAKGQVLPDPVSNVLASHCER